MVSTSRHLSDLAFWLFLKPVVSRIAARVAFRSMVADDQGMALSLAEAVTDALNANLRGPHQLVERGPDVHERSHGFVSFERRPASLWDKAIDVDGTQHILTGSLLFILEYDSSLKSKSPSGSQRAEWARGGGDPEIEGVEVPFTLEVGYFKRKYGMGFSDETRTEVGMGNVLITDALENLVVDLEDPTGCANRITDVMNDLLAHPPAGATEPLKGKARKRKTEED